MFNRRWNVDLILKRKINMRYKIIALSIMFAGSMQNTWAMYGKSQLPISTESKYFNPFRSMPPIAGRGRSFIPGPSVWDDDELRATKAAAWAELRDQRPKLATTLYIPAPVCTHVGTGSSNDDVIKASQETQTMESAMTQNNDTSLATKDSIELVAEIVALRKQLEELKIINTQQQRKIDELKSAEYDWDELREML